jgi:2-amino-4-hydroxy-6-hydroxymethyldihydropteridine diphosphokinase
LSSSQQVFVSLGSNLGDKHANLENARTKIAGLEQTRIAAAGAERLTAPVGVIEQPEFLNQVLRLTTGLDPGKLLDGLLEIENELGRVRDRRWGPRLIDLDILFYGMLRLDTPRLKLPHPQVWRRPFFLEMVAELDSLFLEQWEEFSREDG